MKKKANTPINPLAVAVVVAEYKASQADAKLRKAFDTWKSAKDLVTETRVQLQAGQLNLFEEIE